MKQEELDLLAMISIFRPDIHSNILIFSWAPATEHTFDPDTGISNFNICNTGIEVSRTIKITDSFGIPVTGQLVFNPDREQMFVVVGFTL